MAQLPKLTKAQQEAWARILEWYAQDKRGDHFISGGTREYVKIDSYIIPGTKTIFRALVSKGLLVIVDHRRKMFVDHYAIHPDYLPAASEPAAEDDARPTTDEARLLDSIDDALKPVLDIVKQYPRLSPEARLNVNTMLLQTTYPFTWGHLIEVANACEKLQDIHIQRDIARNEADSLRGQLDALRVRFAEMEAELTEEAADLEATAVREAHLATRVAELEAENAELYEQVEKLNDEAENMSAHIVRVEQARDFWKRKSNPTYDSLKAVSDKQDEVIAALETALDLEKNENEQLRAAVTDARRVVIAELQAAIDNAGAGFRLPAVEQYIEDNTDES